MKKLFVAMLALTALSFILVSCSHKTCDAYSSAHRYSREILR
ncbi:MAG: hypothetical protein U0L38_05315 [Bacteroidales bacterium]|jgi:hypothetical protein|nr:hypothetical protein [Bacteroidales bacterium]MEE0900217.1 hypothetical protein [Bacteroidales bacterium]MEE0910197.1 hypothetical protein [Bacteroidales bacterium]MEE0926985.1 hypothetical protein [Bacteroidales bacterium]MEE0937756.1 hypothetical protein [Bacteroidales bacterium]